jgi:hypothetical protein
LQKSLKSFILFTSSPLILPYQARKGNGESTQYQPKNAEQVLREALDEMTLEKEERR